MKRYEQKPSTFKSLAETECDICGAITPLHKWMYGKGLEERRVWVEVKMESSPTYESDLQVEHDIDICPACFENKLIPWIKSQKGTSHA